MKKLIPILCIYTFLCAVACVIFGYFTGDVPALVSGYEFRYRLYNGFLLFFNVIPAVLFTGITIGCAVSFGRSPGGSETRFSHAMFKRYRSTLIVSLVCVLILTLASELAKPIIGTHQHQLSQMPGMLADYIRISDDLTAQGQYQLARQYARRALDLDADSKEADNLLQRIDIAAAANVRMPEHRNPVPPRSGAMTSTTTDSVYELLKRAENAAEKGDWFSAHYFAEAGIAISDARDINRDALLELSARAWNILSDPHDSVATEDQLIFAKKLEGYSSLMSGDNIHAYYVFHSLSQTSHELSLDPDVVRYLEIAEERLMNECFFIDEQSFIRNFETATDVYFALKPKTANGNTQIVYIKGITDVPHSGGIVQYLRSFSIFTIDSNGNYINGLYVPYAKLVEADVSDYDAGMRKMFGIANDAKFVPELLLRSVDRNDENIFMSPVYHTKNSPQTEAAFDHLFLPISFEDYLLVTDASQGADYMTLRSLYTFAQKATEFGYSREVYSQVMVDRLFYPIFLLALFMFMAAFAWNNRIDEHQLFKFKWIFTFPLFTALFYFVYSFMLWIFKLQNYAIMAVAGTNIAIFASAVFYLLLFAVASVSFLSRNDSSRKERQKSTKVKSQK